MINILPDSVVTIYIGRQAIEIELKYILLDCTGTILKTHNLGILANEIFELCNITEDYMEWVDVFCEKYSEFIEGEHPEYFRYPEYTKNDFFCG